MADLEEREYANIQLALAASLNLRNRNEPDSAVEILIQSLAATEESNELLRERIEALIEGSVDQTIRSPEVSTQPSNGSDGRVGVLLERIRELEESFENVRRGTFNPARSLGDHQCGLRACINNKRSNELCECRKLKRKYLKDIRDEKAKNRRLQDEMARLNALLKNRADNDCSDVEAELADVKSAFEEAKVEWDVAINRANGETRTAQNTIRTITAQHNTALEMARRETFNAQTALATANNNHNHALRQANAETTRAQNTMRTITTEHNTALQTAHREMSNVRTALSTAESSHAAAIKDYKYEVETLNTRITLLEAEKYHPEHKDELKLVGSALKKCEAELEAAKKETEVAKKQGGVDSQCREKLARAEQTIKDFDYAASVDELRRCKAALETAKRELQAAKTQGDNSDPHELQDCQEENKRLRKHVNDTQRSLDKATRDKEDAESREKAAKIDANAENATIDELQLRNRKPVEEAATKLAKDMIEKLEKQLTEHTQTIQAYESNWIGKGLTELFRASISGEPGARARFQADVRRIHEAVATGLNLDTSSADLAQEVLKIMNRYFPPNQSEELQKYKDALAKEKRKAANQDTLQPLVDILDEFVRYLVQNILPQLSETGSSPTLKACWGYVVRALEYRINQIIADDPDSTALLLFFPVPAPGEIHSAEQVFRERRREYLREAPNSIRARVARNLNTAIETITLSDYDDDTNEEIDVSIERDEKEEFETKLDEANAELNVAEANLAAAHESQATPSNPGTAECEELVEEARKARDAALQIHNNLEGALQSHLSSRVVGQGQPVISSVVALQEAYVERNLAREEVRYLKMVEARREKDKKRYKEKMVNHESSLVTAENQLSELRQEVSRLKAEIRRLDAQAAPSADDQAILVRSLEHQNKNLRSQMQSLQEALISRDEGTRLRAPASPNPDCAKRCQDLRVQTEVLRATISGLEQKLKGCNTTSNIDVPDAADDRDSSDELQARIVELEALLAQCLENTNVNLLEQIKDLQRQLKECEDAATDNTPIEDIPDKELVIRRLLGNIRGLTRQIDREIEEKDAIKERMDRIISENVKMREQMEGYRKDVEEYGPIGALLQKRAQELQEVFNKRLSKMQRETAFKLSNKIRDAELARDKAVEKLEVLKRLYMPAKSKKAIGTIKEAEPKILGSGTEGELFDRLASLLKTHDMDTNQSLNLYDESYYTLHNTIESIESSRPATFPTMEDRIKWFIHRDFVIIRKLGEITWQVRIQASNEADAREETDDELDGLIAFLERKIKSLQLTLTSIDEFGTKQTEFERLKEQVITLQRAQNEYARRLADCLAGKTPSDDIGMESLESSDVMRLVNISDLVRVLRKHFQGSEGLFQRDGDYLKLERYISELESLQSGENISLVVNRYLQQYSDAVGDLQDQLHLFYEQLYTSRELALQAREVNEETDINKLRKRLNDCCELVRTHEQTISDLNFWLDDQHVDYEKLKEAAGVEVTPELIRGWINGNALLGKQVMELKAKLKEYEERSFNPGDQDDPDEKNKQLVDQIEDLKRKLKECEDGTSHQEAQIEISRLDENISSLKKSNAELKEEGNHLKEQFDRCSVYATKREVEFIDSTSLKAAHIKLEEQHNKLKEEYAEVKEQFDESSTSAARREIDYSDANPPEAAHIKLKEEFEELKVQFDRCSSYAARREVEFMQMTPLQAAHSKLEKEFKELQKKLNNPREAAMPIDSAGLNNADTMTGAQVKKLTTEVSVHKKEKAELQLRLRILEARLKNYQAIPNRQTRHDHSPEPPTQPLIEPVNTMVPIPTQLTREPIPPRNRIIFIQIMMNYQIRPYRSDPEQLVLNLPYIDCLLEALLNYVLDLEKGLREFLKVKNEPAAKTHNDASNMVISIRSRLEYLMGVSRCNEFETIYNRISFDLMSVLEQMKERHKAYIDCEDISGNIRPIISLEERVRFAEDRINRVERADLNIHRARQGHSPLADLPPLSPQPRPEEVIFVENLPRPESLHGRVPGQDRAAPDQQSQSVVSLSMRCNSGTENSRLQTEITRLARDADMFRRQLNHQLAENAREHQLLQQANLTIIRLGDEPASGYQARGTQIALEECEEERRCLEVQLARLRHVGSTVVDESETNTRKRPHPSGSVTDRPSKKPKTKTSEQWARQFVDLTNASSNDETFSSPHPDFLRPAPPSATSSSSGSSSEEAEATDTTPSVTSIGLENDFPRFQRGYLPTEDQLPRGSSSRSSSRSSSTSSDELGRVTDVPGVAPDTTGEQCKLQVPDEESSLDDSSSESSESSSSTSSELRYVRDATLKSELHTIIHRLAIVRSHLHTLTQAEKNGSGAIKNEALETKKKQLAGKIDGVDKCKDLGGLIEVLQAKLYDMTNQRQGFEIVNGRLRDGEKRIPPQPLLGMGIADSWEWAENEYERTFGENAEDSDTDDEYVGKRGIPSDFEEEESEDEIEDEGGESEHLAKKARKS